MAKVKLKIKENKNYKIVTNHLAVLGATNIFNIIILLSLWLKMIVPKCLAMLW